MVLDPIRVGTEAPDFELASSLTAPNGKPGKKIRLSDFRGKQNVILAFYPLDFSPVCTSENVCFQKMFTDFENADAIVLGVSVDSSWTHAAFARELGLSHALLADFHPKGAVAQQYGLYLEESGMTARATVIVGKDGLVKYVKVQQIPEPRSNRELLEFVKTLT